MKISLYIIVLLSVLSLPQTVVNGFSKCSDGIDNDNDTFIDLADSDCLGEWGIKNTMPTARSGMQASVIGNEIYVIGGRSSDFPENNLTTVEVYNPVTDSWRTSVSLNQGRLSPITESVGGKLYAISGLFKVRQSNIFDVLESVEEYNPTTDTWVYKTVIPTARYGAFSAVLNDQIYVIGGVNLDDFGKVTSALPVMEVYNPTNDSWTSKTPPPISVHNAGAEVNNGRLYVIGGQDVNEVSTGQVQEYNPSTDTWVILTAMPITVISPGIAAIDGSIFVYGGHQRTALGASYSNSVYEYISETDTWIEHVSMPTARSQFASVAHNGQAYSIGGGTYNGGAIFHNNMEVFTPSGSEGQNNTIIDSLIVQPVPTLTVNGGEDYLSMSVEIEEHEEDLSVKELLEQLHTVIEESNLPKKQKKKLLRKIEKAKKDLLKVHKKKHKYHEEKKHHKNENKEIAYLLRKIEKELSYKKGKLFNTKKDH